MKRTKKVPYPNLHSPMPWSVYIIECSDSKLYTGITNNLERRIKDHNSDNGGRFTKYRSPVRLLHTEEYPSKNEALQREFRIKKLTRDEKPVLIKKV
jgi:putative endonuclease